MKRLIVNADDFGYCEAVNYGIVHAHREGVVTSATIMVNMPGLAHAKKLAEENPMMGVGVHLTLSCGKPLTHCPTLVDKNGYFARAKIPHCSLEEVRREWTAQIDRALKLGLRIDHLDSHHHVHTLPHLEPALLEILEKYRLPVRGGFEYELDYSRISDVTTAFYGEGASLENLCGLLSSIQEERTLDLMCHPAYLDAFIYNGSSYSLPRLKEGAILCDPAVRRCLQENGVELTTYASL